MKTVFSIFVGLLTGVLSGFGIGGGTLLLLWLTLIAGMGQREAGGVNLLYFVCCALPALWGHAKQGLIEKKAVKWAGLCGVPACIAGALIAAAIDTTLLRRLFGAFLLVVGWRELTARSPREQRRTAAGEDTHSEV